MMLYEVAAIVFMSTSLMVTLISNHQISVQPHQIRF